MHQHHQQSRSGSCLAAFVHHHLPLSRHTSPLPPNAFSPPKHIPTHNSSCKSLQSTHASRQPNKPLLCPAAGVSDSKYDVSPAVRPFKSSASLSPIKTQTQSLFPSDPAHPRLWVFTSPSLWNGFSRLALLSPFTSCVPGLLPTLGGLSV